MLVTKETRWRGGSEREGKRESGFEHTLLVKNEDVAAVQVDGVSGTQAGHYTTRNLSVGASLGRENNAGEGDLHPPPTTMTWGAAMLCAG